MRVLVTGHRGYIGTLLIPMLQSSGHSVVGIDSCLFEDCVFGPDASPVETLRLDIRDVTPGDFVGFDAVIHLAALSNDPLGDLEAETTYEINYRGAVHVAACAKKAGVERFLQSSTCSLYGAHGNDFLDEGADFNPVTPYGHSKVLAEKEILDLADDSFSPTFLRNATAFGVSPRLRGDLVVNNLVGYAVTTSEVFMKSDGTPWRPLVHIEDIARAFIAILEADRALVHGEPFNVGATSENYQIRDVAAIVERAVPGSRVVLAESAGPDLRNYRVNCDKLVSVLPQAAAQWTVERGVVELRDAYLQEHLTVEDLTGHRLQRIRHVMNLLQEGRLGTDLRWRREEGK